MKWSERQIASFLARVTFSHKHLVIVPNCSWPGAECDLLVVTPNLRIIDVEVKISRADLKADKAKDKWFHGWDWRIDGHDYAPEKRRTREFPRRVWKHYYPGYEKPCNGCGHCCKEEACDLSVKYLKSTVAPCVALEHQDGRYWCGLVGLTRSPCGSCRRTSRTRCG